MSYRTAARFIKDIERCPYMWRDPEYSVWNEIDEKRLAKLEKTYQEIKVTADELLSSEDMKIKQLAQFVIDMIRD